MPSCLLSQTTKMKTRYVFALTFSICAIVSTIATLIEPRFHLAGHLIWPGMLPTLVLFVALHADYSRHAALITSLDILFNALLWTAAVMLIRRLVRRFSK